MSVSAEQNTVGGVAKASEFCVCVYIYARKRERESLLSMVGEVTSMAVWLNSGATSDLLHRLMHLPARTRAWTGVHHANYQVDHPLTRGPNGRRNENE